MKFPLTALALLLSCGAAFAQHDHHNHGAAAPAKPEVVRLLPELGGFSFPVANSNAEAQKFFDQGVTLVYGFNHDEAARSCAGADRASARPHCAVSYAAYSRAGGMRVSL